MGVEAFYCAHLHFHIFWNECLLLICFSENNESDHIGTGVQVSGNDSVTEGVQAMSLGKDQIDAVAQMPNEDLKEKKTVHSAADFLIAYATPEGNKMNLIYIVSSFHFFVKYSIDFVLIIFLYIFFHFYFLYGFFVLLRYNIEQLMAAINQIFPL